VPVERLQKVLARAGVASRRQAEQLIDDGRVRVDGKIVREQGVKVDPHRMRVEVDGRRIVAEKPAYYLLHKPRAVVTTLRDPEGRPTVRDLLARLPERVFPVGRLDFHTSGALLLTNDGDLAEALLRPRSSVPKTYVAKLRGHLDEAALDALRNGLRLDDGYLTKPAEAFVIREEARQTWIQLTLTEGKNRQVHRMADAIGHPVLRLARTEFAGINTDGLRPGEVRPLTDRELEKLKKKYLARGASASQKPKPGKR
jgi:23S rRNA pseudouridine2605 synthase